MPTFCHGTSNEDDIQKRKLLRRCAARELTYTFEFPSSCQCGTFLVVPLRYCSRDGDGKGNEQLWSGGGFKMLSELLCIAAVSRNLSLGPETHRARCCTSTTWKWSPPQIDCNLHIKQYMPMGSFRGKEVALQTFIVSYKAPRRNCESAGAKIHKGGRHRPTSMGRWWVCADGNTTGREKRRHKRSLLYSWRLKKDFVAISCEIMRIWRWVGIWNAVLKII